MLSSHSWIFPGPPFIRALTPFMVVIFITQLLPKGPTSYYHDPVEEDFNVTFR